jgi:phospholipid/cholesterol/gamma-HCH transport system substrate-binding protein
MTTRKTEIQVGIAVVLALAILVLGIMWIGEFRLNRRWQTYSVYFDEVGGLSPGDPVTVAGLELGKVGVIVLEDGRVRADLLIEEEVVLKQDCSVEIQSIGLMGEKFIYILPGNSEEVLPPGSVIEGEYKAGLPEVVAGIGDIMDEMKRAAEAVSSMVGAQEGTPGLGESLAKLNSLAEEVRALLRENKDDIRSTTKSMRKVSDDLSTVIGDRKDELAAGIERFSSASARLDSLTVKLQDIVGSVERGEGTLGMLITQRKLHDDLEAAIENLNRLIADIKEHPERYITIEIF